MCHWMCVVGRGRQGEAGWRSVSRSSATSPYGFAHPLRAPRRECDVYFARFTCAEQQQQQRDETRQGERQQRGWRLNRTFKHQRKQSRRAWAGGGKGRGGPCEDVRQVPVSDAKDEVATTEIDSNRHRLRNVNLNGNMHVKGNVKGNVE